MSFTDTEVDYLSTQPLGRLATTQPDGTLQVSPVGFRYNYQTATIDIAGAHRTHRLTLDSRPRPDRLRRSDHPHPSQTNHQLRHRRDRHRRLPPQSQQPNRGLTPSGER